MDTNIKKKIVYWLSPLLGMAFIVITLLVITNIAYSDPYESESSNPSLAFITTLAFYIVTVPPSYLYLICLEIFTKAYKLITTIFVCILAFGYIFIPIYAMSGVMSALFFSSLAVVGYSLVFYVGYLKYRDYKRVEKEQLSKTVN